MKASYLLRIKNFLASRSKKPWACFETTGPDREGRIAFSINANKAFIENLKNLGMGGINDEETVQMFFLQTRMIPEHILEEAVNPEETPNLTNEANEFRRG